MNSLLELLPGAPPGQQFPASGAAAAAAPAAALPGFAHSLQAARAALLPGQRSPGPMGAAPATAAGPGEAGRQPGLREPLPASPEDVTGDLPDAAQDVAALVTVPAAAPVDGNPSPVAGGNGLPLPAVSSGKGLPPFGVAHPTTTTAATRLAGATPGTAAAAGNDGAAGPAAGAAAPGLPPADQPRPFAVGLPLTGDPAAPARSTEAAAPVGLPGERLTAAGLPEPALPARAQAAAPPAPVPAAAGATWQLETASRATPGSAVPTTAAQPLAATPPAPQSDLGRDPVAAMLARQAALHGDAGDMPAHVAADALDPVRLAPGELPRNVQRQAPPDLLLDPAAALRQMAPAAAGPGSQQTLDRRAVLEALARAGGRESKAAAVEAVDRSAAAPGDAPDTARQGTRVAQQPLLPARDLGALAERIEMLVHRRGGVANVNVSLSELGDVEITVRMEARHAHVQFTAHDAQVRDALEAQLPRLRALLEQGGLSLGDVDLDHSGQSGGGPGSRRQQAPATASTPAVAGEAGAEAPSPSAVAGRDGRLLDAFA